jgi:hypothetical protein
MSELSSDSRVKSGLRRRQLPKSGGQAHEKGLGSSLPAKKNVCGSPLDRLAENIVQWRVLEEIADFKPSASSRDGAEKMRSERIPLTFANFEDYLGAYESLLLEEIRGSVRSSLASNTIQRKTGVLLVADMDDGDTSGNSDTRTVRLSCTVQKNDQTAYNGSDAESGHLLSGLRGGGSTAGLGNLELILITAEPLEGLRDATVRQFLSRGEEDGKSNIYMLALVLTASKGGGQLKANRGAWAQLKALQSTKQRSENRAANKTMKEKHSSFKDYEPNFTNILNTNGKRSISVISGSMMQDSAPRGKPDSTEMTKVATSAVTKLGDVSAYRLHYIVS